MLNVCVCVSVAVPVQFQETSLTVEEGVNLTVTLTASVPHDGFVVNVKIMDGTAKRMHIAQCGLCAV